MKRFIVETDNDGNESDISGLLYLGRKANRETGDLPSIEIFSVIEINEESNRADGKPRMTKRQRDTFWLLCGNYNVPFNEEHYRPTQFSSTSPVMYEGWVGGVQHTIYVGVEPDGRSHT